MSRKVRKSETRWRHQLTPEQFRVTRERGTEKQFSGEYNNCEIPGTYRYICCCKHCSAPTPSLTLARTGPVSGKLYPATQW